MNKSRLGITTVAVCSALLASAGGIAVENPSIAQEKPAVPDQTKQIQTLIAQLGDKSFDVRRAAREKLFGMGQKAVPALTKTVLDKSKDTGYSAIRILSRMMQEGRGKDAQDAKTALLKIAKGDDVMARQAREAIQETDNGQLMGGPPRGIQGIQGFPGGGNIQMQFGGNGMNRTSQTTIVNGVQNTQVRENGRTVVITRDPNGPVSVTVTDKGKKPKSWDADSVDELKKKHPEGFKVFQEYGSQVQIGRLPRMRVPQGLFEDMDRMMQGMGGGFGALPDPFANRGGLRRRQPNQIGKELKDTRMLMQDMSDLLKSLKKKTQAPEVQRLEGKLEALERSIQRIQRISEGQ